MAAMRVQPRQILQRPIPIHCRTPSTPPRASLIHGTRPRGNPAGVSGRITHAPRQPLGFSLNAECVGVFFGGMTGCTATVGTAQGPPSPGGAALVDTRSELLSGGRVRERRVVALLLRTPPREREGGERERERNTGARPYPRRHPRRHHLNRTRVASVMGQLPHSIQPCSIHPCRDMPLEGVAK